MAGTSRTARAPLPIRMAFSCVAGSCPRALAGGDRQLGQSLAGQALQGGKPALEEPG